MKCKKHEVYIHNENGVLERIEWTDNPDRLGNKHERFIKKETENVIGLIIFAVMCVFVGLAFWETLWDSLGV